jgi:hypothetical protein
MTRKRLCEFRLAVEQADLPTVRAILEEDPELANPCLSYFEIREGHLGFEPLSQAITGCVARDDDSMVMNYLASRADLLGDDLVLGLWSFVAAVKEVMPKAMSFYRIYLAMDDLTVHDNSKETTFVSTLRTKVSFFRHDAFGNLMSRPNLTVTGRECVRSGRLDAGRTLDEQEFLSEWPFAWPEATERQVTTEG